MNFFSIKKSASTLIIVGFLLLALFATFMVVRERQELRKKAAAATVLELTPQTAQAAQGDEVSFDVVLKPGVNQVTAADITLTYDNAYLEGISFAAGSLFPNVDAPGIAEGGAANIRVSAPTTQPVTSEGVVATLRLKARNPTATTTIAYDAATSVDAIGESGNAVSSTRASTLTINRTVNATTDVGFAPTSVTVARGDQVSLDMIINTGTNEVTSADVFVNYDPAILTGVSFVKGTFFPDELRSGSFAAGVARITLVSGYTQKTGSGQLARLTFLAQQTGSSTLVVSSQSVITAVGTDENMLRDRGTATLAVTSQGGLTPTPNPTPNATPGATPAPQPSATPGTGGACVKSAPLPPTNVKATTTGTNEITLTWKESLYATHFGVVYGRSPGKYEYGAHNVGYTTVLPVRGLTPNTLYYFAVTAVNDCASSGFSVEVSARTSRTATTTASSAPGVASPLPTYEPEANFVPIPEDIPATDFLADQGIISPEPTSLPPFYVPPEPTPVSAQSEGFSLKTFLSPLVGVLLLIAAIFLGLFFVRLRTKPS